MLHSFPSPYPDELWYSVLCRYIARSGNIGAMQNREKEVPFSLLYDKSMAAIVRNLPEGLFDVWDLVMKHTIVPYITRMQPFEKKQEYLNRMITDFARKQNVPSKAPLTLQYCPVCRREEQERYGESYWHREHQLPLVVVCPKHGCKLQNYQQKGRQIYLPNAIETEEKYIFDAKPHEMELAITSYEYLTAPWEVGPTAEYNNLFCALEQGRYTSMKRFTLITVDPELLYRHLEKRFGEKLVMRYFGRLISSEGLLRIKNWSVTEPERYIMLAALVGQSTDITFGKKIEAEAMNHWSA